MLAAADVDPVYRHGEEIVEQGVRLLPNDSRSTQTPRGWRLDQDVFRPFDCDRYYNVETGPIGKCRNRIRSHTCRYRGHP